MTLFDDPPHWTLEEMCAESARRLVEDLARLGPRPRWWRRRARRLHDRTSGRLKKAHASDLRKMIAAPDALYRAITAHLLGWRHPVYPLFPVKP